MWVVWAVSGVMVALRPRRLEGLFGARLDAVSHAQVVALKTNAVSESYDLEFKGELYGGNDKAKRDCGPRRSEACLKADTGGGYWIPVAAHGRLAARPQRSRAWSLTTRRGRDWTH